MCKKSAALPLRGFSRAFTTNEEILRSCGVCKTSRILWLREANTEGFPLINIPLCSTSRQHRYGRHRRNARLEDKIVLYEHRGNEPE